MRGIVDPIRNSTCKIMNVIIAGSRDIEDIELVNKACEDSGFEITTVFSGCARGVDRLGEQWANTHCVPIRYFPAKWKAFGRSAGPIRNINMAHEADALIALHSKNSRGTAHMIETALSKGLKVFVQKICVKKDLKGLCPALFEGL